MGLDNLGQLHEAIVAGLRTKLGPAAKTVEAYPDIGRRIDIPAVFLELSEFEAGTDPGTSETALVVHIQARVVVDPNQRQAYLLVRELAARIAVAIQHENWGLPIGLATLLQAGEDAMKPELDSYLVWLVEWTHEIHLGKTTWPYPDETGLSLLLGIYPETGEGRADRYWPAGDPPPPDWGESHHVR
ncbi:hypothetical protein FNU76_19180 [Chitinimonas arctica]|uniref:DUF1834 family protein n=1 Tax=Chitinimonas arctica TaxID=2594795 RepID=A0A516SJG9_9NEIS|nr:hypothetical protein [Chitinimonas arctica]QDQ28301.1 hypothetical protein FNU76_19180 [Chitinimonas arctica]